MRKLETPVSMNSKVEWWVGPPLPSPLLLEEERGKRRRLAWFIVTMHVRMDVETFHEPNPQKRSPHPDPLPSGGRGRIVGSRFGNRTLVHGSWSRCMREGERRLSMNRPS